MKEDDWFFEHELRLLEETIDVYYSIFSTGGALHIVLDDHNWRRSDLEFCAKWAADSGDLIGEAIARSLLKIPDEILALGQRQDTKTSPAAAVLGAWRECRKAEIFERLKEDRQTRGITHVVAAWVATITRPAFGGVPTLIREHQCEGEAKEDIEYRIAAAHENCLAGSFKAYKFTLETADGELLQSVLVPEIVGK